MAVDKLPELSLPFVYKVSEIYVVEVKDIVQRDVWML